MQIGFALVIKYLQNSSILPLGPQKSNFIWLFTEKVCHSWPKQHTRNQLKQGHDTKIIFLISLIIFKSVILWNIGLCGKCIFCNTAEKPEIISELVFIRPSRSSTTLFMPRLKQAGPVWIHANLGQDVYGYSSAPNTHSSLSVFQTNASWFRLILEPRLAN